jgi:hypothetical protein
MEICEDVSTTQSHRFAVPFTSLTNSEYVFYVACDVAYMQVLSSVWSDTEYFFYAYRMTSGAHIETH